jgi:hypothetical protein
MTSRTLSYTITRPKVLVPGLFGLGLLIGKLSMFWGLGLVAFALLQASRLLANHQLDDLLRLREEKHRHKIRRLLNEHERREIFAIDTYAQQLTASGGDPDLAKDILSRAWELIREAGEHDASGELSAFRQSLPRLHGTSDNDQPPISKRIQRELDILHATEKEIEAISLPEPEIIVERST